MRVGEIAKRTGASTRAIRYYERAGLIQSRRQENGYREFGSSAVERVRAIRDLLATGFTVEDIQSLSSCLPDSAGDPNCGEQTAAVYRRKLESVEAQMRTLRELRARLRERLEALDPCATCAPPRRRTPGESSTG
jgi:MerR family transcriptional regulator, copper efflux regulator